MTESFEQISAHLLKKFPLVETGEMPYDYDQFKILEVRLSNRRYGFIGSFGAYEDETVDGELSTRHDGFDCGKAYPDGMAEIVEYIIQVAPMPTEKTINDVVIGLHDATKNIAVVGFKSRIKPT